MAPFYPVSGTPVPMDYNDYYRLLGMPEQFVIDPSQLDRSFRAVQAKVHPDRFVKAMDAERRMAMQISAQANEAYRVLSDPTQRALYLCKRHGAPVEVERSAGLDPDFLIQQMEWRETAEQAGGDPQARSRLRELLEAARGERLDRLATLIDRTRDYAKAAAVTRELLFIDKFRAGMGPSN